MIKRNQDYTETVKKLIPALSTIHSSLFFMAKRPRVTEEVLREWIRYVTKHHEMFAAFKDDRGEWFAAEYPEASADLDATMVSLATIRDGLQAKLDAVEADEEEIAPPKAWPKKKKVKTIKEKKGHSLEVYQCEKSTPAQLRDRVPNADIFSQGVTQIIKNELEAVPAGGGWSS